MKIAFLVLAAALAAVSATTNHGHYYSVQGGDYDPRVGPGMSATAHFEMGGVTGTICFIQNEPGTPVDIQVSLDGLDQYPGEEFGWEIRELPVLFGNYPDVPCTGLGDEFTPISCPMDGSGDDTSGCIYGVLNRNGLLQATNEKQLFEDDIITLFDFTSIIGHSLVITRNGDPLVCANIEYQGIALQTLRATFGEDDGIFGDIIFRRAVGKSGSTFHVNLAGNCMAISEDTFFDWSLHSGTCDNLGEVLGSDTHEDEIMMGAFDDCSRENQRACPLGNLTVKCGLLQRERGSITNLCNDDQLGLVPLNQISESVIVVRNADDGSIVGCSPWSPINQRCARAQCFKRPRVNIDMLFYQYDPGDRTHIRSYMTGLDNRMEFLQVRQGTCDDIGPIFDKPGPVLSGTPVSEKITGDHTAIGTLETKIGDIRDRRSYRQSDTTSWLPLFGPYSITNGVLVLYDDNFDVVTCCDIDPIPDPSASLVASVLGYSN